MKRWRYLCAAALIAGSMAAGAGAVSIPSTALTQLLQQWQADTSADSGQSRIAAYALVPKKNLYKISADSLYGIADLKTGKMIVPAEYTTIDVLSDGRFLLTRYENQASSRSIMPMRAERSHRFRRRSKAPISAWQAMTVSSSVSMRNVR